MKVLKAILTVILSFIMFVAVVAFGVMTCVKIILSSNSISEIITDVARESDEIDLGVVIKDVNSIETEELDKALEEIEEYISKEEVYEEIGELTSQIIKYYVGATDEIDTSSIKKTIEKISKKYEEKTGESIDLTEINDGIDEMEKELKEEIETMNEEDREKLEILSLVYNNNVYFGVIFTLILCAVLIVVINKSVKPLLVIGIILSFFSAIGNGIITALFTELSIEGDRTDAIITNSVASVFRNTAIISVGLIVLFIVLLIVLNKTKPKQNTVNN